MAMTKKSPARAYSTSKALDMVSMSIQNGQRTQDKTVQITNKMKVVP
jgi:hypothetical protein